MAALKAAPRLHDHQLCPEDEDWRTWLLLGGRGSGKTFAGAFWLNKLATETPRTFALVGPALHDVREVMVEGTSGLKSFGVPGDRPRWEAGRRRLVWKNGSAAYAFSAEDPDSLRGPQFHAAWADEFCAWRQPELVLSNLRFGLRLGDAPRLAVTTTPRPTAALRRLMAEAGLVLDRGATGLNARNLAPGFLEHLKALYGGTRLEAQEMEGVLVESDGALFRVEDLKRARGARPAELERTVVAVDPPGDATYANYREANAAFWRGTVIPLVRKAAGALTGWLGQRFAGCVVEADLEAIPALQPERDALWARLNAATFLTEEERRRMAGVGA